MTSYRGCVREFVVNVVTESGSVDDSQSNADTVLLKFYNTKSNIRS